MGLKIERGLLDRMVSGAFMGKREIGRPIKYNIRTRGKAGYVLSINLASLLYAFLSFIQSINCRSVLALLKAIPMLI